MSDDEDFDEVFGDLSAFVGVVTPDPKVDDSAFGGIHQIEDGGSPLVDDELILGDDFVTYIINLPGRALEGFTLVAGESEIELTSGDFRVRKRLGVRVDGDDAITEYRNGVLSVRLRRLDERDGGA